MMTEGIPLAVQDLYFLTLHEPYEAPEHPVAIRFSAALRVRRMVSAGERGVGCPLPIAGRGRSGEAG
jgi:hypothetical protein